MANELLGASPLQSALAKLGQLPAQDQANLTKSAFDNIARETKIPANILIALDELNGGSGNANLARENAMRLAEATQAGGTIEDAIGAMAGDPGRAKAIIDRSYDIADAMYPAAQTAKPAVPESKGGGVLGTAADLGKTAAGAAVSGMGSMARSAGVFGDDLLKGAIERFGSRPVGEGRGAPVEGETVLRPAGRLAGEKIGNVGEAISDSASDDFREAMANSMPTGEIFSPSTWSAGDDPSLTGYMGITAQGLGSMLPMLITRNPAMAAGMGGLMSGGEGAENGRQFVIDAARTMGDDGKPAINALPEYQKLIKEGRTHEQATMQLAREAESNSAFRQGMVGALGAAATNKIFHGADGWIGSGGRIARAAKKGAVGALEEGTQEAVENAAGISGINAATGANENIAKDSFGNFVMGAMAGGAAGGAGGVLFGGRGQQEGDSQTDPSAPPLDLITGPEELLALPPPDYGLPGPGGGSMGALPAPDGGPLPQLPGPTSGGTIFGEGRPGDAPGEIERNPNLPRRPGADEFVNQPAGFRPGQNAPADGSGGGAAAAPAGRASFSGPVGAAANPMGAMPPPAGPVEAIARTIAPAAPEPAPAPVRFPEHKPGGAIRLADPETGRIFDAVFLGESEAGARVRVNGQEVDLSPQDFDMGRDAVGQIEAARKAQEDAAKAAQKAGQVTTPPAPQTPETAGLPSDNTADNGQISTTPARAEAGGNSRQSEDIQNAAETWDRENRNNRADAWMEGEITSTKAFDAVQGAGASIPAHGFSKAKTLTEALGQLRNILDNGIDKGRVLFTGPLTASQAGAGSGTGTGSGTAYRDGAFIMTFRAGSKGAAQDITGVLVNPAHAEIADLLQRQYPDLIIRTYDGVADLVQASARSDGDVGGQASTATARAPIRSNAGPRATAITARGNELDVEYAVVDLNDLVPSQLDDGRPNPAYPQQLQPRDRTRDTSQEQIRRIAQNLRPELLGESPQAGNGAPIILPTGEVLSGNGRTLALRRAMVENPDSAARYRQYLADQGYPTEGIANPVLVRKTAEPMDMAGAAQFAREANERDQQAMSTSEQAMADATRMSPQLLDLYRGGDIDAAANRDFVKAFVGEIIPETDQGSIVGKDLSLTQDGLRRINAALLAKAYGDAGIVGAVLESSDSNIRAIGGALTDVAATWAQMRSDVARGRIASDADRTAALVEAVRIVDRARRQERPITDFVDQTDIFEGESVSPSAVQFLDIFYRDANYRRPRGRAPVADMLAFYANEAIKTSPGVDMFGDSADTGAILNAASGRADGDKRTDEPAEAAAEQRAEPPAGASTAAGRGAGDEREAAPAPIAEGGRSGSEGDRADLTPNGAQADAETTITQEAGADGLPQSVMPGMERSDDQAAQLAADQARREMEARQQQSKIRRRGGNSGDAGPLFGDDGSDLFDNPRAAAKSADEAAAEADTSPTDAQKEAGNYKKGHMDWNALDLTIENAKGSTRSGRDGEGNEWSVTMPAHYGYFKGTEGADGDHVDFYMGDVNSSDYVMIVDQADAETGKFDEHKVIIGTTARGAALGVYRDGFSDGRGNERIGAITETTVDGLKAWLLGGRDRAPAAGRLDYPFVKAAAASKPAATGKIEDFGEKLGGARKDSWAAYGDKMKEADSVDISAEPLSKSWPVPDYEKMIAEGVESWKVDLIRVTRDAIPTKPQKSWRLAGWVKQVDTLRTFANRIMDGTYERADIKRVLGGQGAIMGQLDLYEAVGHSKSLKGLDLSAHSYSLHGGVRYSPPKVIWEVTSKAKATAFSNMPRTFSKGDTKEEAIAAFKKVYAGLEGQQEKARKIPKFAIYAHDNRKYFTVGTKVGSTYLQLRRVDDVKEARRIIAEESDQLEAELAKRREIPADRRPENVPRVGIDHRSGANITPEQFGEAFGFRGVEFGNWVEGKRRQQDLNNAYDALMDLAGILDIPARAISLNGTMGLAFGARGTGGVSPAAAHYEPGKVVINLTKMNGAGSLAHEWFHAVDNHFARRRTDKKGGTYITDQATRAGMAVEGLRSEVMDAFVAVRAAITKTKLRERSKNIDSTRSKAYWSTGIELHARAFESYVIGKLQDQSAANDYLANVVEGTAWQAQAELSGLGDSYPYLTDAELEIVRPAFDALFQTIQNRETDAGVELYQRDIKRSDMPIAVLAGDELGKWSNMVDLQRKAQGWYRANLQGKSVVNKDTGWEIRFTRDGSSKVRGKPLDYLLRAIPALTTILENASFVGTEADRRGREHVKAVHKFRAEVEIAGRKEALQVIIREMADGRKFYDLNLGEFVGARNEVPKDARNNRVEPDAKVSADTLNIAIDDGAINGGVESAALAGISNIVTEMLAAHGIHDRVTPKIVRGLLSNTGVPVLGSYRAGEMNVSADATNPGHVTRHEIIHALRDANLWGKEYGLFTPAEWRALARAARGNVALRESVEGAYGDLDTRSQTEEMIAEMYADWATGRAENSPGALGRAFEKVQSFFRAMASALRGEGYIDAASIMRDIANGQIGGRGPDDGPGGGFKLPAAEQYQRNLKDSLMRSGTKAKGMIGNAHWITSPKAFTKMVSNRLTDAMGKNETINLLGLVPGRPLFTELGKNLAAAQEYLGLKERMDAERNEWQALSAKTVDRWTAAARKHPEANERLMELMHDTTIAQIDPSKHDGWRHDVDDLARDALDNRATSKERKEWARGVLKDAQAREAEFGGIKARFDRLPKELREVYGEIRDSYSKLADAEEEAVMENIRQGVKATLEQARREAKRERQRIADEMPAGSKERNEAMGKVSEKLAGAEARAARSSGPWIKQLRQAFESNRVAGPYFPLSRQGQYFAAVRDTEGNLIEFQRFEKEADQQAFAEAARKESKDHRVKTGIIDNGDQAREAGDPRFVADVEKLLAEAGASKEAMDAVWQRYLQTMPSQSMRKSRIHRKGTRGYNKDAMRAFASGMFHGAHQVARLKFGTQMTEALAVAKEQAAEQKDANRAGFVVREMEKRHAFAMNPTNNPLVTVGTTAAFIWYLGMSPAAALVNASQTTVVGIPLMRAHYKKAGTAGVTKALTKASLDFMKGKGKVTKRVGGIPIMSETWSVENAPGLTADERKAMEQGYERGVIDKTQAHDLAAVAESGVQYNPTREKVMRIIGWGFHHTERFNREVTYLAAYRLAREQGMDHEAATRDAGKVTWNVHFDYSNTSRSRAMQGDAAKLLLIFRNFQVNMLYRLFRDTHQALVGASKEERSEARNQLIGVSLSMFAHAGIRGVWGYGLLMMLLGAFFGAGGDEADEWLQDALLIEGDGAGTAAWNWLMGLALSGAPGHVTGTNLTERIGMPNLWFRGTDRELDGQEWWMHYVGEMGGPLVSIPGNMLMGAGQAMDGHLLRGLEKMTPVFARNPIKTARYMNEGVTTMNGDELVDSLNPWQLFVQANGFSPAEIAERYKVNSRLKNREKQIGDTRKGIVKEIGDSVRKGEGISEEALDRMKQFNLDYPEWPITSDSIRQSVQSRERASQRNEFGISLNPKLNDRLRGERAPMLYN